MPDIPIHDQTFRPSFKTWGFVLIILICFACWPVDAQKTTKIIVNGVELHYTTIGEGDPVVCIHGTLEDYREFDVLARELWYWGYRAINYSRRYNTPNNNPDIVPNYSAKVDAVDLGAFLDALGLESVHLVGRSFGALTALQFTLDHPERVRSLVLAEPLLAMWLPSIAGGEGMYEAFIDGTLKPSAEHYRAGATDDALRAACDYFIRPGAFDQLIPILRTRLQENVREWGAVAMSSEPFPPVDKEAVARITVPVLLLNGRSTLPVMRQIDTELRRLLPKSKSVILDNATHDMINEVPVESSEAIVEFIESTY